VKKKVLFKSLMIVLPILAVGLATTTNSVTVFNTITGETQYYSYFDVLPVTNLQMITPLTALLAALSGVLAAVYMATKRHVLLKVVSYAALASAAAAAIPMLAREEIIVLPNVGLPIFMMVEYCVAYYLGKENPEKLKKGKNVKLKKR
jgi:hypothetical protein